MDEVARIVASRPALQGCGWSLLVCDLTDGHVLYAHDPQRLLLPASNMKLLTAAAALRSLGADYRYTTALEYRANETLVLVGSGDPALSTSQLDELATAVSQHGVTTVGDIVVDESHIDNTRFGPGWAWDDEIEAFNPPLGALGVDENVVTVCVSAALVPFVAPRVQVAPDGVFTLRNDAATALPDGADSLDWTRLEGRNELVVRGVLPMPSEVRSCVPVADGATYAATVLRDALRRHHVTVTGTVRRQEVAYAQAARFRVCVQSAPLRALLVHMMKRSDNYYAEQLLRTLGRRQNDAAPTSGLAVASALLAQMGLGAGTYTQVDGSGLSRYNLVTVSHLVSVLRAMVNDRDFVAALDVAGVDGTLVGRFTKSPLRGRLRAKTGTMGGVSALSGYVCDDRGKPRWVFSFIINGALGPGEDLKTLEEDLMNAIFTPLMTH